MGYIIADFVRNCDRYCRINIIVGYFPVAVDLNQNLLIIAIDITNNSNVCYVMKLRIPRRT